MGSRPEAGVFASGVAAHENPGQPSACCARCTLRSSSHSEFPKAKQFGACDLSSTNDLLVSRRLLVPSPAALSAAHIPAFSGRSCSRRVCTKWHRPDSVSTVRVVTGFEVSRSLHQIAVSAAWMLAPASLFVPSAVPVWALLRGDDQRATAVMGPTPRGPRQEGRPGNFGKTERGPRKWSDAAPLWLTTRRCCGPQPTLST